MEGGSAPRDVLQTWLNRRGPSFSEVEVEVEQTAQAEPGGQPPGEPPRQRRAAYLLLRQFDISGFICDSSSRLESRAIPPSFLHTSISFF